MVLCKISLDIKLRSDNNSQGGCYEEQVSSCATGCKYKEACESANL